MRIHFVPSAGNVVVIAGLLGSVANLANPANPASAHPSVQVTEKGYANADALQVRQRLRDSLLPATVTPKLTADAESFLRTLRADGSWPDQVYTDTNRENWKAAAHLGRVLTIARAYYANGSTLSPRPDSKEKMLTALGYWLQADPKNDNWWHNMIGVPLQVGETLILMGGDAPAALREQGIRLLERGTMEKMTGQNLVWGAEIQIMRGCLADKPELVAGAYNRMWQEVRYAGAKEEGIQSDASFHQHGPLLYTGGYGAGFVSDVTRFVGYAAGTSFAIPPEKKAILDRYVLDGVQWMLRDGQWDWGVTGRELIRAGKNAGGMASPVVALSKIPGARQAEMLVFANRISGKPGAQPLVGNRHFWMSDYMSHRRPGYFATTRMNSVRTANTDGLTNGENKKSHNLADGAMYLSRDGQEYFGIFPVWEWHLIPGTTAEQNTVLVPEKVRRMGATRFNGGVSDGMYGLAAMDLSVGDLQAKKAWFYFDNEIVCLGAGITDTSANPVATSLNQSLLRGPVQMSNLGGKPEAAARGEHALVNPSWVWHDQMGYVFPTPARVQLRNDAQTGSYRDIGPGPTTPITKDVFRLSIDHGVGPRDGAYAYVVVPASTAAQTAATATRLPLEIVQNTPTLQAVWHKDLKILGIAFRTAGDITAGGRRIKVDQPCLVLLRQNGKNLRLAVSNPENTALTVRVQIGSARSISVDLPAGLDAGKSVVREISGGSSAANAPAQTDLTDARKKDIAMQIVSSAENSTLDWKAQYAYIEDIGDGRGYTAGIIGFCSGTGDMLQVVESYTRAAPKNILAKYLPALRAINGTPSHAGLDPNFTRDWKTTSRDPLFRKAQDSERDSAYFLPAVRQAKADGLRALGQFVYYDAIVMHGPGETPDSFGGIRQAALKKAKTPAQGGSETEYLNAFLDARSAAMRTEAAHSETSRVDTAQRVFLRNGNFDLNPPLVWKVYGENHTITGKQAGGEQRLPSHAAKSPQRERVRK